MMGLLAFCLLIFPSLCATFMSEWFMFILRLSLTALMKTSAEFSFGVSLGREAPLLLYLFFRIGSHHLSDFQDHIFRFPVLTLYFEAGLSLCLFSQTWLALP